MPIDNGNCNCNNYETNSASEQEEGSCNEQSQIRQEMADKIRNLEFSINELALYLDVHPEDSKAICLHRKYAKEANDLKQTYQKVYGPLTINCPCNKWRWLEQPWPWERGNY